MMTDQIISFFDCAQVPAEGQISVLPVAVEETVITVKKTVQTAYVLLEKAARRFKRWLTVTAENFCRAVRSRICAFIRQAPCLSGVQILRKCVILRF